MFLVFLFVSYILPSNCHKFHHWSTMRYELPNGGILWPNHTVPYYFTEKVDDDHKFYVEAAMNTIMTKTCVDFEEAKVEQIEHGYPLGILPLKLCLATPGVQETSFLGVTTACLEKEGQILKHLFYVLGVDYTHLRWDRDDYVMIEGLENKPAMRALFEKNSVWNGFQYDYSSVMHYDSKSLSLSGKDIIVPFDDDYHNTIGSLRPSFLDFHHINQMYHCYESCPDEAFKLCQNGGVPNPRNCKKCNCPTGYGGDYCTERPDCGLTLTATSEIHTATIVGPRLLESKFGASSCTYWIQAPTGTKVEVLIDYISVKENYEEEHCQYYGIEIKTQADRRLGGPVLCNMGDLDRGRFYRSELNPTPLIVYNSERGHQEYDIYYRFVREKDGSSKL